jgi:hypothetical protein
LSQTDSKIVNDIQATLKSLLGSQWDKIYIPQKNISAESTVATSAPLGSKKTDQFIDDFLSDIDESDSTVPQLAAESVDTADTVISKAQFDVVSSPQDQLAEMTLELAKNLDESDNTIVMSAESVSKNSTEVNPVKIFADCIKPSISVANLAPNDAKRSQNLSSVVKESIVTSDIPAPQNFSKTTQDSASLQHEAKLSGPQQDSPADFVIIGERPIESVEPEELLRLFEGNFKSSTNNWKRNTILAVLFLTIVGLITLCFSKYKSSVLNTNNSTSNTVNVATAPTPKSAERVTGDLPVKSASSLTADTLLTPTFIPTTGLDKAFSMKKPGWERYVGSTMEFRVYRTGGKIKALQVLGLDNHTIGQQAMVSMLKEVTGVDQFTVKSREVKNGLRVERAMVVKDEDLLIYRNKIGISAFVVALD